MALANRVPDYIDLDLDFLPHPVTGDISKKVGIDSITRSVRNLVMTNFYERPFRSHIGSNATKLLFENITPLTASFLQNAVIEVIKNFEPRVNLLSVRVRIPEDTNSYIVDLAFNVKNRVEPIVTSIFLQRIR